MIMQKWMLQNLKLNRVFFVVALLSGGAYLISSESQPELQEKIQKKKKKKSDGPTKDLFPHTASCPLLTASKNSGQKSSGPGVQEKIAEQEGKNEDLSQQEIRAIKKHKQSRRMVIDGSGSGEKLDEHMDANYADRHHVHELKKKVSAEGLTRVKLVVPCPDPETEKLDGVTVTNVSSEEILGQDPRRVIR